MGINDLVAVFGNVVLMRHPLARLPPHSGEPPRLALGVTLVCLQGSVGVACLGEHPTKPETVVHLCIFGEYLQR